MSNKKNTGHRAIDLVKGLPQPKYEYQKLEYGFGSVGGKSSDKKEPLDLKDLKDLKINIDVTKLLDK